MYRRVINVQTTVLTVLIKQIALNVEKGIVKDLITNANHIKTLLLIYKLNLKTRLAILSFLQINCKMK